MRSCSRRGGELGEEIYLYWSAITDQFISNNVCIRVNEAKVNDDGNIKRKKT